jgi:CubicO group peptidase (beta-lactamase class C family)
LPFQDAIMTRTFRFVGSFTLSLLLLAALSHPAPAQLPDTSRIDTIMRDALKTWQVPGAALAIVRGDAIVYLKAFGVADASTKQPVTPDTVFAIGSCTKSFTSCVLAMLCDEGKVHWDDPVRKHVPFFRLADPLADANVTLRDLLCHRTGVGSHDLLWYRAPWGLEEMIRKVGRLQPEHSFRSAFEYQTILYATAGYAAGTAANTSWGDLIQQRIFEPLEMTSATVTTTAASRKGNQASPHLRGRDGLIKAVPWYAITEPNPAGSINASARDLARWIQFQLGNGTYKGKRLLSAANLAETHTPQFALRLDGGARLMHPDSLQLSYAMGWVVVDHRGHLLYMHGGAIDGFRAQFTLVPDAKLGLVLLHNFEGSMLNLAVNNTLLDLLLGHAYKDWNAYFGDMVREEEADRQAADKAFQARRHKGTKPSRALAAYVGTYEDPAYGTARVTLEDGALFWHWSSFRCPLEHYHFDTFTAVHAHLVRARVVFALDADGEVGSLRALGREFTRRK